MPEWFLLLPLSATSLTVVGGAVYCFSDGFPKRIANEDPSPIQLPGFQPSSQCLFLNYPMLSSSE